MELELDVLILTSMLISRIFSWWESMGSYAIFLGNGDISWFLRKQSIVSLSSTEFKYIVHSEATWDILWTQCFPDKLGLKTNKSTALYEDNQGIIVFAQNQKSLYHTKHINMKVYFIKFKIDDSIIDFKYRPTLEMVADIYTKIVSPSIHTSLASPIVRYCISYF